MIDEAERSIVCDCWSSCFAGGRSRQCSGRFAGTVDAGLLIKKGVRSIGFGGDGATWGLATEQAAVVRRRALFNNDDEQRTDSHGLSDGLARSAEVRLGGSAVPWQGALSLKWMPVNLDLAYVRNMARARVGELFGTRSNSIVAPFTVDHDALRRKS